MNLLIGTQQVGFAKDVVYNRFLNSPSPYINWSKFIIIVAINVISNKVSPLTSKERINVLILDDTLYSRTRSKCVELLANVHDHSNMGKKFKRGFRQLTLAWSDGCTLITSLHTLYFKTTLLKTKCIGGFLVVNYIIVKH